jgi:hypothetical protein
MGAKIGTFVAANDHTYEVKFEGDSLSGGTLILGVPPVVIAMEAGQHKFCGFKTTTATVNIVTDSIASEFYADAVDGISLTVTDLTDDVVEFDGYVLPFAFDQSYDGDYTTITVDAVDRLSVRKNMKYADSLDAANVTVETAFDIVAGICERAGIKYIIEQESFEQESGSIVTSPLSLPLSQCGFVQDDMSDCDVVSAIAQFFGYTAIVKANKLILYDETCKSEYHYLSAYENNIINGWSWNTSAPKKGMFNQINLGTLATLNSKQYTIERAYDGIVISPEGSSEAALLPDICADENVYEMNTTVDLTTGVQPNRHTERRTVLQSRVMDFGFANSLGSYPPIDSNSWEKGSLFMRVVSVDEKQKKTSDGETFYINSASGKKNVLWVRTSHTTSDALVATPKRRFSHPGGYIKISFGYTAVADGDWKNISKKIDIGTATHKFGLLNIKSGGYTFKRDYIADKETSEWSLNGGASSFLMESYNLLPTGEAQKIYSSEVILRVPDGGGAIQCNVAWYGSSSMTNYFIESLSVTGFGDDMNTEHPDLHHSFNGRTDEMLEVSTVLTTRKSGYSSDDAGRVGVNARPSVVASAEWNGRWHLTARKAIPITGCLMEQLKSVYGKKRVVRSMTVRGCVRPYDILSGAFVEAYEWDIYDNKTTIQI